MPQLNDPTDNSVLRTVADELFELVKNNNKISVEEAAKKLKIPYATAEALADFLVEEKVFGIEYKFTTPYIYLYKEGVKGTKEKSRDNSKKIITKEYFYKMAKEKNIPYEHIGGLWRDYIKKNLGSIREEFLMKSREKKIPEEKIEGLWKKYMAYI